MRIVLAIVVLLLALGGPAYAARVTLTGDVTYRERIALPPGGTLIVSLVDLAAPTQPRVSAQAAIASPGGVPLTFTLNFDESVVLPGHDYALDAEITGADGTLWFRTSEPYAVDPLSPPAPLLIVVALAPQDQQPTPEPPAVVPERDTTPLLDVTWQAVSIAGTPVGRGILSSLNIASDMRAGGRGGCNSWFAQAEVNNERLLFSAVAATRMACSSEEVTRQEDSFFGALAATRFWRVDGKQLALLDARGGELARLEKSSY